mmetsp:Transcript_22754/g.37685  ORF Transcript_22754/g.37685 Transcript_22754/m.37685 type:complete len:371 (+) Transcript_22754:1532-2644(+)
MKQRLLRFWRKPPDRGITVQICREGIAFGTGRNGGVAFGITQPGFGFEMGVERLAHGPPIQCFHGATKGRGHLQQVRHALDVRAGIGTGGVKKGRVKEHGIPLFQGKLDVIFLKTLAEVSPAPRGIARSIQLRERQELGRATLNRHIAVGNGPLQGQTGREVMHMRRVARADFGGLKAKVVVTMRLLRGTARMDQVHLRRHLVVRAKPGLRDGIDRGVGHIAQEYVRRAQAQFLVGIPDAIICACGGKVIRAAALPLFFLINEVGKHPRGRIQNLSRGIGRFQGQNAGAVLEHKGPLGHQRPPRVGVIQCRTQPRHVVDRYVLGDLVGLRHRGRQGRLVDQRRKVIDVAVLLVIIAAPLMRLVFHTRFPP